VCRERGKCPHIGYLVSSPRGYVRGSHAISMTIQMKLWTFLDLRRLLIREVAAVVVIQVGIIAQHLIPVNTFVVVVINFCDKRSTS